MGREGRFGDHNCVITGLDPVIHAEVPFDHGWLVYILASRPRGTLYVGVTNDLVRRVHEHRAGSVDGFSKEHGLKQLVYYEHHETMPRAIQREKNIKHWSRQWKIDLIVSQNPDWRDLWDDIMQ